MAIVSLKIGERFYKFSCADGQENYMRTLAEGLDARANNLIKNIGFMQEGQLLAMLCLLLAEEKSQLEKNTNASRLDEANREITEKLSHLTNKIINMATDLNTLIAQQPSSMDHLKEK
ncbi:MAG: cell division protein ZapA [Alphaproteobacteria bacterium]|nr:cell division protein ZapA [Alphaproteobacteria bacterium]